MIISLPSLVTGEKLSFFNDFSTFLAETLLGSVALYIDLPQKRIFGTFVIRHFLFMSLHSLTIIVLSLGNRFLLPVNLSIINVNLGSLY